MYCFVMELKILHGRNIFFISLLITLAGCMAVSPARKTVQINPEEQRCKRLSAFIMPSESEAEKKRLLNLVEYVESGCLAIMKYVPQATRVVGSGNPEHFPTYKVPAVLAFVETMGRDRALAVATQLAKYDYHAAQSYLASKLEVSDQAKAVRLYRKAALGNQCSAQLRLGWAYYTGSIVPKNLYMSFF